MRRDEHERSVLWIAQRRELIRLAWRRALSSPTPQLRERWRTFAKRLEDDLADRIKRKVPPPPGTASSAGNEGSEQRE